jgi:hypothetical protein
MKTLRLLPILVVFFLLNASAHALVVVYKGSGRFTEGNSVGSVATVRKVYLIMDATTLKANLFFVYPAKKQVQTSNTFFYGVADIATKPAHTIFFTAAVGVYNSFSDFRNLLARFYGRKAFQEIVAGAGDFNGPLPKTLAGTISDSYGFPFERNGNCTLTFDKVTTQDQNANGRDIDSAGNDIINKLTTNGYVVIVPTP